MKKIGIIGLGLNNPYFYAPLLRQFRAQVSYVWDYTRENAQAYADRFGCTVVENLDSFPSVDGVLVDSRNCDHIELGRRFRNAVSCVLGKSRSRIVLMKPLSS